MSMPTCKICGCSGAGIEFAIFNPAIPPFGTACAACEEKVQESIKILGINVKPADCTIREGGEVWHDVHGVILFPSTVRAD